MHALSDDFAHVTLVHDGQINGIGKRNGCASSPLRAVTACAVFRVESVEVAEPHSAPRVSESCWGLRADAAASRRAAPGSRSPTRMDTEVASRAFVSVFSCCHHARRFDSRAQGERNIFARTARASGAAPQNPLQRRRPPAKRQTRPSQCGCEQRIQQCRASSRAGRTTAPERSGRRAQSGAARTWEAWRHRATQPA